MPPTGMTGASPECDLLEHGYCVLPGYIAAEHVSKCRAEASMALDNSESDTLQGVYFLRSHTLCEIVFSPKCKKFVLESPKIFPKALVCPNFTVRRNIFVDWHCDDAYITKHPISSDAIYALYNFNVYLQKNDTSAGGGLDIIPGSHKLALPDRLRALKNIPGERDWSVRSEAGDLIIFDSRCLHRSTKTVTPPEAARLAVQWSICSDNLTARAFLDYLHARALAPIHPSDFSPKRATHFFASMEQLTQEKIEAVAPHGYFDRPIEYAAPSSIGNCRPGV